MNAADKIKVTTLDELPRHTYALSGTASEALASRDAMLDLASRVKHDVEALLDEYDLQDRSTLKSFYGTLLTIASLQGDEAKVREHLDTVRALEDKEANRLTMGLVELPFQDARRETDEPPESAAFRSSFRKHFAAAVARVPWDVAQDNLEGLKGQSELLSAALIQGIVASTIDPAVAKTGWLSGDSAAELVALRHAIETLVPVKEEVASVLGEAVAANRVERPDIWPERAVTLTAEKGAKVRVGIWDTGVDVSVFPSAQVRGSGIAFDKDHDRVPDLLYPLGAAAARRDELEGSYKGYCDLQAALDTAESLALKRRLSELAAGEVQSFLEDLMLYTHHAHGTHVAGIAIAGNPHAEIVAARLGTDHRLIPDPPTMELARKLGAEFRATVDFLAAARVRVVNMSWGFTAKVYEDYLEKNGIGENQEERAAMAREMFAVTKSELRAALESAPGILFVAAAGNSDDDVDFGELIPPSFDLPNLLVVGAVDQSGEATHFTSFGRSVDVYASGFEVDSFVPGGNRMKLSGTSMASPNAVNLAAKLFALDPSLTPEKVAALIRQGAEPRGADGKLLVIHPKRTVGLL